MKDLSTSCVFAIAFCCIGLLSPRGFVEVKVRELVTLGSLDPRRCSYDLLWSRLLWLVGIFCGHLGAPNPFVGCASRLL